MRYQAFDNEKYIQIQSEHIKERISKYGTKLYLEFGGKLFDDEHASRVLPGFLPDSKLQMLLKLKEQAEVVIAISAMDIENNKRREDHNIGYDMEVLRLIEAFQGVQLNVHSVVITHYKEHPSVQKFEQILQQRGIQSYKHYRIEGYPHDIAHIVSEEGYGKNEYIETTKPLVVVTAPGPGSGKMATCLSQLYHEHKRGVQASYAKFETFPVWNLSLKHPVNLAYEAATADLNDLNMIDPFHLEAYGQIAINYNRDIEVFPVLKAMLDSILGECPYKSPTDMGVNCVGLCLINDEDAVNASKDEILRRYYQSLVYLKEGKGDENQVEKLELLISQAGISKERRKVVLAANQKREVSGEEAFAMELSDGHIVVGRRTKLLGAVSACVLNALKYIAKIDDSIPLISPHYIEPITDLKTKQLGNNNPRLHLNEVLIALSISAMTSPLSALAMSHLKNLEFAEGHGTTILEDVDLNVLRKLKVYTTTNAELRTKSLYKVPEHLKK